MSAGGAKTRTSTLVGKRRTANPKMDKQAELDKMIMIETTKQLDKFSNIFYNKIKLNAKISEF